MIPLLSTLKNKSRFIFSSIALGLLAANSFAQVSNEQLAGLKYRMIGPHRAGRTVGISGVADQPNVFYIGVNNGGVWKTTDYGHTWKPIFDAENTGSVGDVAVAPSNSNVIYVGSGEGIQRPDLSIGNGLYKSSDAGKTWTNMGLHDAQQIGGISIDPTNENRIFVAALGHPYGPNKERGVYRSLDGGKTLEQVLYIDENTGAVQVLIDPNHTNIVFATIWAARQGPWENGAWDGEASGLYKSMDGGNTWKKITKGFPTTKEDGLGRIGFTIAPSNSNRMYATVDAAKKGGIYRSDDAGESWYLLTSDGRLWGRGSDFAEVKADPKNEDIVYSANVVMWRSKDGGKNWEGIKGAPGGDDYHRFWINPNNTNIIAVGLDQGGTITVNGGETYSSWYNQATAQFYHVSTDNAFPYNVYGGQQESGSVGIASRSNDGGITFREWHPVGVEEYGYVAADPLDPNIIYGGKITKYDKRTAQVQNIAPIPVRNGKVRFIRTAPVLFSPVDNKTLFFAGNIIFKTTNGGSSWETISPDLTRATWDIPASVGIYNTDEVKKMRQRGVVYSLAPSYQDINVLWAGTDDGLIHITKDGGKHWKNITPTSISSWSKISMIDASRFDVNTAYVAVNRIRVDDMTPHIYKTTDGGITWKKIINGLPNEPINSVREDAVRKGLLFAGSENAVYFSLDAGENWQSLKLNMPATSIRDLVIKDDDLVIGTHGRSFWILDNITPLRQINLNKTKETVLFKPQKAMRIRWNMNTDTPLPPEEPAGENPPDGAMIDYYLNNNSASTVKLEILNTKGELIRTITSKDTLYTIPEVNIPLYWIRPQQILAATAGAHRFLWDMKYEPLNVPAAYPMKAIIHNTPPDATAPWVMPGTYKIRLTVDGQMQEQPITITMDPRVKTSTVQWQRQHDLSMICYEGRKKSMNKFPAIYQKFTGLFNILENTEMAPTSQTEKAVKETQAELENLLKK
jgi:photosystem II stability/assembly factor-like uncharacterized protein